MEEITVETRFGALTIRAEDGSITRVRWGGRESSSLALLRNAARQLAEYDAGERQAFDLPIRVTGAPLQRAVCDVMREIPFGETMTYGEIARRVGASAQAVGQACGRNPVSVLVPCHRVLGAKGLTGFSGGAGIETKVALLRHEKAAGLLI